MDARTEPDWGEVARRHAERVYAAARELAPDADAAWDAVQEAFLTAISGSTSIRDPLPWLCGVARNHARHGMRSASRFRGMLERLRRRSPPASGDPATILTLSEALSRVSPRLREAVVLKHVAGMTVPEVARAQGVTEAAARSRVRRGLARLRRILPAPVLVAFLAREAAASDGSPDIVLERIAAAAQSAELPAAVRAGGTWKIVGVAALLLVLAGGAVLITATAWWSPDGLPPVPEDERRAAEVGGASDGSGVPEPDPVEPALDSPGAARDLAVSGAVVDPDGNPIPGVRVRAIETTDSLVPRVAVLQTRGAEDGTYALGPLPEAVVTMEASADGRASVTRMAVRGGRCDFVLGPAGRLSGRVRLESTGAPCAGALVSLRGPTQVHATRTDGEGRYVLDEIGAGHHDLYVIPDAYPVARVNGLRLRTGERMLQDVFVLEGLRLEGRVIDAATGEPIAGARIGESYPEHGVETDAAGRFVKFVTGPYGVLVEAEGYLRTRVKFVDLLEKPEVLLTPAWCVSGTILDADGRPVGGARITVDQRWAVADRPLRSAPDGSFTIAGQWPATRIRLTVVAPGRGFGSSPMLDLETRPVRPDTTIRLGPGGAVRGTVVDATGRPVAGVVVRLVPEDGMTLAPDPVVSGPDGSFAVDGIVPGSIRIWSRPCRGEEDPLSGDLGTPVVIVEGATSRNVMVTYGPCEVIAGRMVDSTGRPLPGVPVTVTLESDGSTSFGDGTRTDVAGRFRFPGLVAGSYRIDVTDGPYERFTETVASGTEDLSIIRRPWPVVSGRVRSLASPVRSFTLRVRPADEDTFHGNRVDFSDGEGRFALPLPPGTYWLEVTTRDGRASPTRLKLMVPDGGPVPPVDLVVEDGIRVSGTVRTPDGQPRAGCQVCVRQAEREDTVAWTRTDARGAYRLAGLPAGRQLVGASDRSREWLPASRVVVLAPGGVATVDLVLRRSPGSLRLRVQDGDGRPIPDAEATFVAPDACWFGGSWYGATRQSWERRRREEARQTWPEYLGSLRRTDAAGRIDHPGLVPARYRIEVRAEGFRPGSVEVVIEEGGEATATVTLER